ncbi:MAG: hypothetical protein ABGY96_06985 [bacterium]
MGKRKKEANAIQLFRWVERESPEPDVGEFEIQVLDIRLTRSIGRENNLEVWL